jgi:hypothetical protein
VSGNVPVVNAVNARAQLLCAWCSPAATVMWLVGFLWLAGFAPPLSPAATALEIQAYYQEHRNMIQAGLCFTMLGAALIGPFVAVISTQLKRIEGTHSPLANTQLGLGMLMILLFVIPCFMLGTAAYRPERDPELIMLLNDAGWLPFVGAFQCTFIQLLAIALAIFKDKEQRVFPRWLGYFNVWVALLLWPAGFVLFLKTGPFAWDGELAFWLVLVVFCGWFLIMFNELRKTIRRQAAEAH